MCGSTAHGSNSEPTSQAFSNRHPDMKLINHPEYRAFLDGELPVEREADLLRQVAADQDARELLRQEILLRRTLQHGQASAVPAGFVDRVMARLPDQVSSAHRSNDRPALRRVPGGRQMQGAARVFALAAAVVAGVLIGSLFAGSDSAQMEMRSSVPLSYASAGETEPVVVQFYYADGGASSVAVIGDFSHWEPVELTPAAVGTTTVWTGRIRIPRGEHRYMFLVDGTTLVTDPLAPVQQPDGFGNKNALLAL